MHHFRLSDNRHFFIFICLIILSVNAISQVIPLPHAYAHNDYLHKRPLFDALDNGFTNIEADIYLRHSRLLVAHWFPMFKKKKTIEGLYLQPLFSRLTNTSEQVQSSLDTIVLMIDIKSKGKKTYEALRKLLDNYKGILSTCENGKVTIRNLTLVLTGHCPVRLMEAEESRFVFADADLRKINRKMQNPDLFTIASCRYSDLITWRGKGSISDFEKRRLHQLVDKAHLSGTKVRLWGSPENEKVWHLLRTCGVDLINTDKILALKHFFINAFDNPGPADKL